MKPFTRALCSVATLTALVTGPASAGVFGSLANFDAINDTGVVARGFEIELEGITKGQISDVFGLNRNFGTPSPGDVERYGLPTIGDLYNGAGTVIGAKVTYLAKYAGGAWSTGTAFRSAANPFNTPGESCWTFGNIGYPNVPCDHFGVSTLGSPSRTTYSWLIESGPGSVIPAAVAIPPVIFAPPPAPAPGLPQLPIVVVIQAQQVALKREDNAFWVKIVQTTLPDNVDLNELMGGHHAFENKAIADLHDKPEVEIEWQVLQPGKVDEVSKAVDIKGNPSLAVRYEFFKYTGSYDDDGYVDPKANEWPTGNNVAGLVYVGEQIAGFNAVQGAAPIPEPAAVAMMLGGLAALGFYRRRRTSASMN